MKMTKALQSVCWTLFLTVLLLGIPKIAGQIASAFDYAAIDPDGVFAWLAVHHLAQGAIFLAIIAGIRRIRPLDFGFSWGNRQVGRRYVLRFTLIFSLFMVGSLLIMLLTKSLQPFPHPLTARNLLGYLGFQLFLSGPSEELIFRAFAITMLGLVLKGRGFSGKASYANIVAAVIFGLAHVSFSFAPFRISYAPMQVIFSVVLGLFDGDCYEKSGSVFYPMMMHSISNVLSVSATILLTVLGQ
ncbi:MAG: CPBP family intramembrane metalloprotease [Bacillota bacterium]|nr:CPBP family intramembrane metalloprotease [Bacillota bacterium]